MKNKFFLLCLCVLFGLNLSAQKYGADVYGRQQRQPSSWQGTGWAINDGYVVTNFHVVDGARSFRLKHVVGDSVQQFVGEVAVTDPDNDLAIIKIVDPKFSGFGRIPYALKTAQADVGESVFVLGYPMTDVLGDEIKLTTGVISSHTGYQGDATSYQVSAPVQPGNSGGPLFDDNGNVIACVNAKVTSAENVSYAIKAQYVDALIARLPSSFGVKPINHYLENTTLPNKVKAIKSFIFTIYASTQPSESLSSSQPKHSTPHVSGNERVIELPYVDFARSMGNIRIQSITLSTSETIVEFVYNNQTQGGYYPWITISKDTYLNVSGQKYVLRSAEGIAIAPNKTIFNDVVRNKVFRLIFPAIPQVTSFDLIEPGDGAWKFYGISTK